MATAATSTSPYRTDDLTRARRRIVTAFAQHQALCDLLSAVQAVPVRGTTLRADQVRRDVIARQASALIDEVSEAEGDGRRGRDVRPARR